MAVQTLTIEVEVDPTLSGENHYDLNGNLFEPPTFTIKQIRDAIPPHCFQSSTLRSLGYVARDLTLTAAIGFAATHIHLVPNEYARLALWALYTVVQGMVWTGIWILAHECGHGAFSSYRHVNNTVGLVLHSFLLVPFHSWRITHRNHHKATGNVERDTVFIPHTRESWVQKRFGENADHKLAEFTHLAEETPLVTLWELFIQQAFGWPAYLMANVAGQRGKKYAVAFGKKSHFYTGSDNPLFTPQDRYWIVLSDIGIAAAFAAIYFSVQQFGALNVFVYYGIPYLWVNHWLVALTYLQHTDPTLPHYSNNAWTFPRGASATIDRDFGFIGRHLFHRIIETHVLHHMVSSIPFYHAEEATQAIKGVMGDAYRSDTKTNFLSALWKVQRQCKFTEESVKGSGVLMYRNLHSVVKAKSS